MKLNKNSQYGLLLVLYLSRSGKASLKNIAESLNLSLNFLEQVARKLRLEGVVKSDRGPGGGTEVVGKPTLGQVIRVFEPKLIISAERELQLMTSGQIEDRSLLRIAYSLNTALHSVLFKTKVADIGLETVERELAIMNTLPNDSIVS